MFIIAQLPLADLRPLIKGGKGHLAVPDWASENLDSGFVRGFGKISPRNGSSLGLGGERSFADINNALRFNRIEYRQEGWTRALPIALWFRRLYYDGLFDKIACAINGGSTAWSLNRASRSSSGIMNPISKRPAISPFRYTRSMARNGR